jgi:thiol:disulfide interchange protein
MRLQALAALLILPALASAEAPAPAWTTNWAQARSLSLKEKKPVLLYFRADWCAACATVEKTVVQTPQFRSIAARTVLLRADVDTAEGSRLQTERRARYIPTMVVVEADGRELGRTTGPLVGPVMLAKLETFLARRDKRPLSKSKPCSSPSPPRTEGATSSSTSPPSSSRPARTWRWPEAAAAARRPSCT